MFSSLKMDSLRLNGLSQSKFFCLCDNQGAPSGPLAGTYANFFWLSQTSAIVTPRCDLSWTTDMVTNHVWLKVRHGYKTCLVTGLNSPYQNQKTEFRNMHLKPHKVTLKLPLNSLTLSLSY